MSALRFKIKIYLDDTEILYKLKTKIPLSNNQQEINDATKFLKEELSFLPIENILKNLDLKYIHQNWFNKYMKLIGEKPVYNILWKKLLNKFNA